MRRTFSRPARPSALLEALEPRQLLAAALPGTLLSSFSTSAGAAEFLIDNPATNLTTRIAIHFQHQVDSTLPSPMDALNLSVGFFDRNTGNFQGLLQNAPTGSVYTVSDAAGGLRLAGDFPLAGSAFGVTFQNAILNLDIQWSALTITQTIEHISLQVTPDSRQLSRSALHAGTSTADATVQWMQASGRVLDSFPTPQVLHDHDAFLQLDSGVTHSLPASINLQPWISRLSPPNNAPLNAFVEARSAQSATVALQLPGAPDAGGINASHGERFFNNAGLIPASAYWGYFDGPAILGGQITSQLTFSPTSVTAKGAGTGERISDAGSTPVPFAMDLQWTALPGTASLALHRKVITTPEFTSMEFTQSTQRQAAVTGTFDLTAPGTKPTLAPLGTLSQLHEVVYTVPTTPGVHPPINSLDWQNFVLTPWQAEIRAVRDDGLYKPGKARKPAHHAARITPPKLPKAAPSPPGRR